MKIIIPDVDNKPIDLTMRRATDCLAFDLVEVKIKDLSVMIRCVDFLAAVTAITK